MPSCEFWEISKKTFSYRTPPVAASGVFEWIYTLHFRIFCLKKAQYLKFKWTVTSWKCSSKKFFLLCCRLLESFNENVLPQWGLDKYFSVRFLLVATFFASVKICKKELYHRPSGQILIISYRKHRVPILLKLFFNYLIFIV